MSLGRGCTEKKFRRLSLSQTEGANVAQVTTLSLLFSTMMVSSLTDSFLAKRELERGMPSPHDRPIVRPYPFRRSWPPRDAPEIVRG